ncbi:hypothetical protein [Nocardioides sp. AE5]|uniref:hypothetical protein n=1 Tax=Nocardioides sp. AE5 TaxID=2962573 RepID=UPI002882CA27|nr:hypothetical protein [Nocardioides sp. AE5]MDT0203764.1 hypothetical protein [Nocardioides sp. AE5]
MTTPATASPQPASSAPGSGTPGAHRREPRPRKLGSILITAALGATGLVFLSGSTATAAVSLPVNGSTVSGNVAVVEATGATSNCLSTPGNLSSRIRITRVADGAVVHTASRTGTGSLSTTWASLGEPRGQYRVESFANRGQASGFLNLSCTTQAEAKLSEVLVLLDNGADVAVTLPSSVVTGEELPVSVQTSVVGTGVAGQPLGGRAVTIDVPGVGQVEVETDAEGRASTTLDLPDLPAGPLAVSATVATDPAYTGRANGASTTLDRRTTQVFYRGDTRQQPGRTARISGQLVDVTPGSDRFGAPIAQRPLVLGFEGDAAEVETNATGRALRSVQVSGASRTVEASASFAGDQVYAASADTVHFFVGDDAADPAPVEHGTVGGNTRGLASLLNGLGGLLGNTITEVLGGVQTGLTDGVQTIDDLLAALGASGTPLTDVLHLLDDAALVGVLDDLLGTLTTEVGTIGDPVDAVIDGLLGRLTGLPGLGGYIETATFDWRAVHVAADGTREARQFRALIGVPEPLDVTGDGVPDVLANLTLASGVGSLGFSNVDNPIELALDPSGEITSVVPRLEIARLPGAPADLPLSLQAILTLPGSDQEYRFGYDTRESNAPAGFRADVVLADGGAGLQIASRGDDPLTVTGALVASATSIENQPTGGPAQPNGLDDDPLATDLAPAEQRFGVSFSTAPGSARLVIDLGAGASGQNLAATLQTDQPTQIGIELADDSGAGDLFLADGVLDSVDGTLAVSLAGDPDGGLAAEVRGDQGMDALSLRARSYDQGRIVDDIQLGLTDVPDTITFSLGADGTGELTTSGAIGIFEAGYGTGREIALLDDPAYVRLLSDEDTQSIALRLPGFEGMALHLADTVGLDLTMAPTPLRVLVDQDGLELDASILDAPHVLGLSLSPDGEIEVRGSAEIGLVTVSARNAEGLFSGATDVDLRLEDVPALLAVGLEGESVVFDTGGDAVGLLELFAHSGEPLALPGDGDGLVLQTGPDSLALAGRVSGLRTIEAALGSTPDLLLDTVAGEVFTIVLREVDANGAVTSNATATLDHLVPDLRLRLVDDGAGAMVLDYSASEPTNSLSFDFDGLAGSISGPLPAELLVCFAGDEACLPDLGITNPDLGSIRFAASEFTTINLSDPSMGLSAQGLRARVLELTGSLDIDNGGDVYLNTAEFGGECGWDGCRYPLQGGKINVELGSASLLFEPGNGFDAYDALTHLRVDKLFGQPIGVSGTGGTGQVVCVGATKLDVSVSVIGLPITLSIKDAICNVSNRTPRPAEPANGG